MLECFQRKVVVNPTFSGISQKAQMHWRYAASIMEVWYEMRNWPNQRRISDSIFDPSCSWDMCSDFPWTWNSICQWNVDCRWFIFSLLPLLARGFPRCYSYLLNWPRHKFKNSPLSCSDSSSWFAEAVLLRLEDLLVVVDIEWTGEAARLDHLVWTIAVATLARPSRGGDKLSVVGLIWQLDTSAAHIMKISINLYQTYIIGCRI